MKIITSLLIIALTLISIAAKSDEKDKIIKYFDSEEFHQQLYELGMYWDKKILNIQTDCKSKYVVKLIGYNFLKPLKFDSDNIWPTQGLWTFRYSFSRCDEIIIYNALFSARTDKIPQMAVLVPGTTRVSPVLLQDLYVGGVSSVVAAKSKNKECKKTSVLDTKVTIEPTTFKIKGKEINGVWEEQWIVSNCDEKITVAFCLTPDGVGGTHWATNKCPQGG